jgi:CubicO group peptidase (beta-lactamase class C family)
MAFPGERWEEASPESQGVDSGRLRVALEYLEGNAGSDGIHEVAVVRNGRMIWHGDRIDEVHGVWSCTKSFTSTVLGLLVDDGKCELDTRAWKHVPELKAAYPDLTLRHFTTMTSGYRAIGDEPRGSYRHGPSSTPFEPSGDPLFRPPGSQYAYWDSAMNMFGLVLTKIAGESMEELFARRIAEPIGMDPEQWDWGNHSTMDGVVVNGGSGNSNKHVFISARQMARLGHLFLNRGKWKSRQLIGREWVETATSVHVPAVTPWAHPVSKIDGRGVYGLNWWANGVTPSGRHKWPDAPDGTFAASGHNNNKLFVIPEWNMVIVRLGLDQKDGKIGDEVWNGFLGKIGEAVQVGGRRL